jgi:ABC-type dipeptide/oligopeptide/nickel transport system ATPase component
VVGESGCGKSTLVRAVLGILPRAARVDAGRILFAGEDLLTLSARDLSRRIRGKSIGFIPQDPFLALNPVFTVGTQLLEILLRTVEGGDWWFNLRPSNTEPLLRLNVEAATEAEMARVRDEVLEAVGGEPA